MSTKSSIILTDDDEHWYIEHNDGHIYIELAGKNFFVEDNDEDGMVLKIKEGTHLHKILMLMYGMDLDEKTTGRPKLKSEFVPYTSTAEVIEDVEHEEITPNLLPK